MLLFFFFSFFVMTIMRRTHGQVELMTLGNRALHLTARPASLLVPQQVQPGLPDTQTDHSHTLTCCEVFPSLLAVPAALQEQSALCNLMFVTSQVHWQGKRGRVVFIYCVFVHEEAPVWITTQKIRLFHIVTDIKHAGIKCNSLHDQKLLLSQVTWEAILAFMLGWKSTVSTVHQFALGENLIHGWPQYSVSAQDGIVALGKAHTRSAPSLSSLPRLPSKQCQYLPGWTQITVDLGGWNVGRFLSPLLFPSGGQCCDALACPCWESSSSLWAPLPCQAADQMWYLLCLPVYLPVHSHWLRRAQDSRSTDVFVAEDCAWLCASRGSPFQTPPFAGGSLSLWEWRHV